jgi:hypothetical protein
MLCGQDRGVPKKKLDLLQFATANVTH